MKHFTEHYLTLANTLVVTLTFLFGAVTIPMYAAFSNIA